MSLTFIHHHAKYLMPLINFWKEKTPPLNTQLFLNLHKHTTPTQIMILVLLVNIVRSGILHLLLLLTEGGNVMMSLLMLPIKIPCSNSKPGVCTVLH